MKSQDSGSKSYIERARNGVGIAFAGALKAAEVALKVTTAGLAVQAGLGLDGANALSMSDASNTALAHRDGATTLRSKEFPNLPERFVQQQQEQKMRRLVEKARENPEILESLRELFKESQPPSEQESNESERRLLTTASLDCLNVDNTGINYNLVNATDFPGREMRTAEFLRIKNNCPMTSYRTGFNIVHDVTSPSGTSLHTADPFSTNAGIAADPLTLSPGGEAVGINDPDTHRYQCRTDKRAYAPLKIVETVVGSGFSNPTDQGGVPDISSPVFVKTLYGESPQNIGGGQ
jgi:hypothetical protein